MSQMSLEQAPEWDLADRMRKSLRHADIGVAEMASYLGVSPASVSNWINGHNRPSKPTQRLWAMRCGVPLNWLLEGEARASFNRLNHRLRLAVAA